MATSTIPAVKAGLLARLQADSLIGGAGVDVTYGLLGTRSPGREWVVLGDTRSDDPTRGASGYGGGQTTAAMGQRRREERYVLEAYVSVVWPALDDQQGCTERAFAIAAAIETSLRNWSAGDTPWSGLSLPTGARFGWALVTSLSHREGVMGDSHERTATVFIDIACAARI